MIKNVAIITAQNVTLLYVIVHSMNIKFQRVEA